MNSQYLKKITRFSLIFVIIFSWIFGTWLDVDWLPDEPRISVETAQAVVPSGVIIAWPSTNASIPSGWTRVTSLDNYFLEATTSTPSTTPGGSADHTHTSPTHTHTIGHTHTGTTGIAVGNEASQTGIGGSSDAHTHTITTATSTGSNNTASANLANASNTPPYTEVIFIKSAGTTEIPNGAWAYFNSDSLPTNWDRQSNNRFLKGAATSSDGGGTGGSSDNHGHIDYGHTHTENAHTHNGTTTQSVSQVDAKPPTGGTVSSNTHIHTISGGSATATESQDSGAIADGDGQPPWYKLNIIRNNTGSAETPDKIIAMWDGPTSTIPAMWDICDGSGSCPNLNDKFIKGSNADSELGNTGGNLTHTHAASTTHSHTINSHTHNISVNADATLSNGSGFKTGNNASLTTHTHTLSITQGGGDTGTATITANANSDNKPPYKEIIYIQYNVPAVAITLKSDGNIDFGTLALGSSQHTNLNGLNDPELIFVDAGPADLYASATDFTTSTFEWIVRASVSDNEIHLGVAAGLTATPIWNDINASNTLVLYDAGRAQNTTSTVTFNFDMPTSTDSYSTYTGTFTITAAEP